MFKGFKEFILRGNVMDLAVAVVIGAAFSAIVTALVNAVFNPLLGALFNAESLAKALPLTIPTTSGGEATLYFGAVIGAVIQFLLVAAVVYFVLVVPMNKLKEAAFAKKKSGDVDEKATPTELEMLTDIRDLLARQQGADTYTDNKGEDPRAHS